MRTWLKVAIAVVVTLALIGGGLGVWYSYTQRQFFVGPDGATVAIFKGVPEPVLNLPLSRLVEADTTRLDDLPPYYQEQVRATIRADSLASARGIVASLRVKAHECIAQREARATATPTPSASPEATTPPVSPDPDGGPLPSTAPAATPTPTDSPPPAPEEC